ncbi:MAG: hypothetical protein ACC618_02450 [Patescibacteria group bacterium]
MGKVEAEPEIGIVPPAGCKNSAECKPVQELVSEQKAILATIDTPIEEPTIRISCEPSQYDNGKREIKAFSTHRFVYNSEYKMTVPQTVIINGSDSCSRK